MSNRPQRTSDAYAPHPVAGLEPWRPLKDAADHLGVKTSWIYNNQERLNIPRTKIGNTYRYKISQLDQWAQDQAVGAH